MTDPAPRLLTTRVNWRGGKLYREFVHMPRVGDFLNLTTGDDQWVTLKVTDVWFGDFDENADRPCHSWLNCELFADQG